MKLTPAKIVFLYLLFAVLWILTTDAIVDFVYDDASRIVLVQLVKGLLYVALTAVFLYWMIRQYVWQITAEKEKLKRTEKSLNLALSSARMAIWEYFPDEDRYITSTNHHEIFGYEKSRKLTLGDVRERIHPDYREEFDNRAAHTLKTGDPFDYEYVIIPESGVERWIWTRGMPTLTKASVTHVQGVTIDITERKELELQLLREKKTFEALFKHIPVPVIINTTDYRVEMVNDEFCRQLGWSRNEIMNGEILELAYPDPDYRQEVMDFIKQPNSGWREFEVHTKNGELRHQLWTNIILPNGRLVGVAYDITERRELQQKLEKEREELRLIFNSMPVLINVHAEDREGVVGVNRFFEERLGYTVDADGGDNVLKKMTTDEEYEKAIKHIKKSDGSWQDFELITQDGETIYSTWSNIRLDENKSIGIGLDISERKQLEKSIEEHRERLRIATDSANVALWEWHPKTGKVVIDEVWARLAGYTLEELEPIEIQTWYDRLHPDDHDVFERTVEDYFAGKIPIYQCEVRMRHKEGHWVWILDRGRVVERDENGEPVRLVGTHVDITEQKRREQKITEQKRLLRESQRVANLGTYVLDLETGKGELSSVLKRMIGVDEDVEATLDLWASLLHPDYSHISKEFDLAMEERRPFQAEYKLIRADDGAERWIFEKADIEFSTDGEITQVIGTMQDITPIKEAEQKLEEERNRFQITTNLISDVVWEWDLLKETIWWSEGLRETFGYDPGTFDDSVELWKSRIHPDDADRVHNGILQALEESDVMNWSTEYRYLTKEGDEKIVEDSVHIYRDSGGTAIRVVGALVDLTEERKSRELDRYQANLLKYISDSVIAMNPDFVIETFNQSAEQIYGYSRQEAIGAVYHDLVQCSEVASAQKQLNKNGSWEGEVLHRNKHGDTLSIYCSIQAQYDVNGKHSGYVAVNRDITELKKTQQRLAYVQKRFEFAAKVVSDVIWDANPELGTLYWSEGLTTVFGHDVPPVDDGYDVWKDNIHPDDRDRVLESMDAAEQNGSETWMESYRFLHANGEVAYILDQAYIERDENGAVFRIIGAMNDLTSEREAEEELKESERKYRLLFEYSPLPMWICDPNGLSIIEVNQAAIDLYGYSRKEFENMSYFDLHPAGDQAAIREEAKKNLQQEQSGFDTWKHVTKSGDVRSMEISGTYIYSHDQQRRLIIANDITEQLEAEKRALRSVVEGEERERKRIANELHDGLGQYLSAAKMNLESLLDDEYNGSIKFKKPLQKAMKLVSQSISETRAISQNLLPKSIQDYGLELAVASLVANLRNTSEIKYMLFQKFDGARISESIQVNLYRVIQEALNNVLRHSGAKQVYVQLIESDGDILCSIEDDGTGFDLNNIQSGGLGLQSMKTRVAAMDGNLDIETMRGGGTLISVIVPIQ
ncbi:MAG: PAS domain-containing protein [Balneolaceae bacterium]